MEHPADELNVEQEQNPDFDFNEKNPDFDFEAAKEAPQGDELTESINKLAKNRDDILREKRETMDKNKSLSSDNEVLKTRILELEQSLLDINKSMAVNSVLDAVHDNFKQHVKNTLDNVVSYQDGKTLFKEGDKVVAESVESFLEYAKTNAAWTGVLKAPNTQGVGAEGNGGHSNGFQTSSSSKSTTGSAFGIGK